MRFTFSLIGYEIPSQNTTMRRHWSANNRERQRLERWIRALVGGRCPPASGPRSVHLLSIRTRRITDDANLRGGAKSLVDAIVAAGLLVDDNDSLARITYSQQTLGQAGITKPTTVITIDDTYDD